MDKWPVLYKAPLEGEVEEKDTYLSCLFNGQLDILELCKRFRRLNPEPWTFVMEPGIQVATKKDRHVGWDVIVEPGIQTIPGEEFREWQRRMYLIHGADYRVHSVEILEEPVRLIHVHYGSWGIKKLIRAAVELEIEQLAAKVHASIARDMVERIYDQNAIEGEVVQQPMVLTHDKDSK